MNDTVDIIDLKELLINDHSSFLSGLNGKNSPALRERREKALSQFAREGFPTTADEEWKYTNLGPLLKKDFSFKSDISFDKKDIDPLLFPGIKANTLIFINGVFSKEFSSLIDADDILEIKTFAETDTKLLEKYFIPSISSEDAFTSLNIAFSDQGVFIRVPQGKIAQHPVILYFISDLRHKAIFSQPRNIIVAEENSQVTIIESFHTLGNKESFMNCFTEIFLKRNSVMDYYKVQREGNLACHVGTTQVVHEAKSNFSSSTITLGGAVVRNNLNIRLNAEHCECFLYGLYLLDGKRHADNHSLVDHAKPNCYSNELYKGILTDKSTGVFNGKILVRQDAQKTNAFQSNKNILLSPDATMNAKPQLEIFADDVKCSHGATVGQLNEEPLFYLRSRGLSENNAKALLTMAFAEDIIENIKIPALREFLKTIISESLSKE
jgi:Fe-S cluster assembly protein SufD